MTAYERLDLLLGQNNGIVKTAQVLENGITKSAFYACAKQRGVEQAAHGVYVSPDARMSCTCCTFAVRRLYFPIKAHCFSMT